MQKQSRGFIIVISVMILALTASGCAGWNADKAVTVNAAVASNQELGLPLELSGVLAPANSVDISSKLTGQVVNLVCKVGSPVKTGDVLMQLDTEALKGQLMQAQAGLQSAQASARTAANQVALSKISLDAAQKNYDRTKALLISGAAAQSQMDEDRDKLDTAQKQYDNASGPALEQAQAAIDTANATIRGLNIQIANCTVTSPLNGIIATQNVNRGEVVGAAVPVISIVDTSVLKLKSTVSQDYLPLLSDGQAMKVVVDTYPNNTYSGIISSIGPIALNTGEVFPVEIAVKNDGNLRAGLSAHASLSAKVRGIMVPSSAVAQKNGESYVFIIKDNKVFKRVVSIGLKNDKETQILKGVSAGDRVVVTNVNALADQMPVVVIK